MPDKMSIDATEPIKEDSDEFLGSSPEADAEADAGPQTNNAQENQQPKRKGGRKPIYATSEERKQRNRQAQAAFRERRTEYIKQLEETIRIHEGNLQNLQTAHRTAADECLMLRYKNSLLERILLEKGIDVQAELRAKTGSPNLGPTHAPQNLVQPPPIQRAIMNRHHQSRRSNSSIAPKLEPGAGHILPPIHPQSSTSPKNRPTPSSHSNSPTGTAPTFGSQPALSPATSDHAPLRNSVPPTIKQQLSPLPGSNVAQRLPLSQPTSAARTPVTAVTSAAAFYPTPSFQNHIEQLEQEYDAPTDMLDDSEIETSSGPGPYPSGYAGGSQPMNLSPTAAPIRQIPALADVIPVTQMSHQPYPSMTQLLDSGLEWDPFGLSASMAFPTQFSFDQSNLR